MRKVAGLDIGELGVALRRGLSVLAFGVLPVALFAATFVPTINRGSFAYDFRGDLYDAAQAILHGRDPYRYALLEHLAALRRAGLPASTTFAVPVYPAPALLSAVPLALLPLRAAGFSFAALSIAALVGGLWLLGVRDWRCYGAAFLSYPVLHSLCLGQLNGLLVFGIGVAWHWRRRKITPALAVASLIALKLFLWPLGLFVLFSRRYRVTAAAVALVVAGLLVGWAVIGFDGMTSYPHMLSDLSSVIGDAGVSYVSIGNALGVAGPIATAVALALTAGLLGLAGFYLNFRGEENRALGLAVMAALIASPVVWPHYLTLVLVPIALVSPRLSPLWFVPLLAWLAPAEHTGGDIWKMLPYVAIEVITVAALCFWPTPKSAAKAAAPAGPPEHQQLLGAG